MPVRKSTVVTVGAVAVLTVALILSEDPDYDFAAVCVDEATKQRVDDDQCDGDHSHVGFYGGRGWYYVPRGGTVAPVGQQVSGGSTDLPFAERSYGSGFDRAGGIVTRGGFSHGFGSFGG